MYKAFNEYRETSISSVETSFELSSSSLFHVLVAVTNIILLVREGQGSKKNISNRVLQLKTLYWEIHLNARGRQELLVSVYL